MSPTVTQTLDVARSQLGTTEPGFGDAPGTQVTKYGQWYAAWSGARAYIDTYWCAMYVSWVLAAAGHSVTENGRFGNCNPWIKFFQRHGRYLGRGATPPVGALVFYDWDGDNWAEHIGFVEKLLPDGRLQTLEGNATLGGRARDGVYRMKRSRTNVLGYGVPVYGPTFTAPSMQLPGPIAIGGIGGRLGTHDARVVPWRSCPVMPRGFGGPENTAQRTWCAYWYRLLASYAPGYFAALLADPAGKAEVARLEIGPASITSAEKMLRQRLGANTPPFHGVIPAAAWQLFQPAQWP